MNRAQRRKIQRENQKTLAKAGAMSQEARKAQLFRNGITSQDLQDMYNQGWEAGFSAGNKATINTVYASVCLALHDEFGFAGSRCWRVLMSSYNHILNTLLDSEIIQRVYDVMGIEIVLDDPLEPVIKKAPTRKMRRKKHADSTGQ